MTEKERFVMLARTGRFTITELCSDFGISRKTGHKYLQRYDAERREGLCERIVQTELKRLMIQGSENAKAPKGAEWKVQIAKRLRKQTTAKNPWIAKILNMGHPNYVSNLVNKP